MHSSKLTKAQRRKLRKSNLTDRQRMEKFIRKYRAVAIGREKYSMLNMHLEERLEQLRAEPA